jgi:hypothetical protein
MNRLVPMFVALLLSGCGAPSERLSFPAAPMRSEGRTSWYDVSGDGRADFSTALDDHGRLDVLSYDDDQDGSADRVYRMSDYSDGEVPHVVLMLDSVPYASIVERYLAGGFSWFAPPRKVIAPFPSLTEVCYGDVLGAPPLAGIIDRSYDTRKRRLRGGFWQRLGGDQLPWEKRLDYTASYYEGGQSYLHPVPWYEAELERARQAIDQSTDRLTLVYFCSSSGMLCKYGREGCQRVLDGAASLCLQLIYERRGAIRITMMSDHGHNYVPSRNIDVAAVLREAGLRPTDRLSRPDDVVLELSGLVTYAAAHTQQPRRVADALLARSEIEFVMYKHDDAVLVRSTAGSGQVYCDGGQVGYRPLDGDPLGYAPVLAQMRASGAMDDRGLASDDSWLSVTADHEYPDAPRRIWDALHRVATDPPRVMFTLQDGSCAGLPSFERFIGMASTHGGLNQANTATFVMSMTGGDSGTGPLRSRDVMAAFVPEYRAIERGRAP